MFLKVDDAAEAEMRRHDPLTDLRLLTTVPELAMMADESFDKLVAARGAEWREYIDAILQDAVPVAEDGR
jgi:hypothetical protein